MWGLLRVLRRRRRDRGRGARSPGVREVLSRLVVPDGRRSPLGAHAVPEGARRAGLPRRRRRPVRDRRRPRPRDHPRGHARHPSGDERRGRPLSRGDRPRLRGALRVGVRGGDDRAIPRHTYRRRERRRTGDHGVLPLRSRRGPSGARSTGGRGVSRTTGRAHRCLADAPRGGRLRARRGDPSHPRAVRPRDARKPRTGGRGSGGPCGGRGALVRRGDRAGRAPR